MKNPMLLKPKMWVYLVMLAIAVGLMVSLYRCSHGNVNNSGYGKSGGDTIDVAIEYSPLSLYMYDDTLGGFSHDLIRLIEKHEGIAVKMHPVVSLSESLKLLDDGIYDVVAAQIPATTDFKQRYLFTDSIYLDRQVLVQLKDSLGRCKVNSQLDIAGKTLHIVAGSPVATRIENFSREIGDTVRVLAEPNYGQEQLFLLVATGEIEYAVISSKVAKAMSAQYPMVDIGTSVSFNQFQSWVLRKGDNTLCDSLNHWLRDIRTTKEYKELVRRYF